MQDELATLLQTRGEDSAEVKTLRLKIQRYKRACKSPRFPTQRPFAERVE